jgi:hypothetical protein
LVGVFAAIIFCVLDLAAETVDIICDFALSPDRFLLSPCRFNPEFERKRGCLQFALLVWIWLLEDSFSF